MPAPIWTSLNPAYGSYLSKATYDLPYSNNNVIRVNTVRIELARARLVSTARAANHLDGSRETRTAKVSQFIQASQNTSNRVAVAINADAFGPYTPSATTPYDVDLRGFAMANGQVVSQPNLDGDAATLAWNGSVASMLTTGTAAGIVPPADTLEAVSGFFFALKDGIPISSTSTAAARRSAVGLSSDGKYLYLLTIDPVKGSGATLSQLGQELLNVGASDGICLDGAATTQLGTYDPGTQTTGILGGTDTNLVGQHLGVVIHAPDIQYGGGGDDTLTGTAADDVLTGAPGNDQLRGEVGADSLYGNSGNDSLNGGAGNDFLSGGAGIDTADYSAASTGVTVNLASGSATGDGTDALNTIENVVGSGLADVLIGDAVANALQGGGAADVINGAAGADVLTGGLAADTFVFAPGTTGQTTNNDTITDYQKGAAAIGDLIDHSANLSIGGSAAAATSTQASINQSTGVATFASGSGGTLADALGDIASRFTGATDAAGEFALFRVASAGSFYLFISDGQRGVGSNDVVVQLTGHSSVGSINLNGGNLTIVS